MNKPLLPGKAKGTVPLENQRPQGVNPGALQQPTSAHPSHPHNTVKPSPKPTVKAK